MHCVLVRSGHLVYIDLNNAGFFGDVEIVRANVLDCHRPFLSSTAAKVTTDPNNTITNEFCLGRYIVCLLRVDMQHCTYTFSSSLPKTPLLLSAGDTHKHG
jgi:hypothetical protein